MNRPGTALQAITFALKIEPTGLSLKFLQHWMRSGAMSWGDYLDWLQSDAAKKIEEGENGN